MSTAKDNPSPIFLAKNLGGAGLKLNKLATKSERFVQIAKLGEIIFHARDLANLWQIKSKNTLHTTLKRYVQKGLLFRIYRGLYSIKPINEVDPWLLGIKALHGPAYVGCETILAQTGVINQNIGNITLISSKSKKFSVAGYNYYSRKLQDKYLQQTAGVIFKDDIKIATAQRAVADLLYFNRHYFFDNEKRINWPEVKKIQKIIGYPLTAKRYDFTKSKRSHS